MTKKLLITGLMALAVAGGYMAYKGQKISSPSQFTIGAVLPLTGDYASVAQEINRGALLAIDEAKARSIPVVYLAEDDGYEPRKSVNAAQKILSDNVDVAFTVTYPEIKPIGPLFNARRVPVLTLWDSNEYIKNSGPYVFTMGFSTEKNGEKMANYAIDVLWLKNVAVLNQEEEWSALIADSFTKQFEARGGRIAVQKKTQMNDRDFRTIILQIKQSGADGIYFPLNTGALARFLRQARELKLSGVFMTGDALIQDDLDVAGAAAEGIYLTNIFADRIEGLNQKYRAKHGTEPGAPIFVSFGYDAINVLLEGRRIAAEKNIPLRDALTTINIHGTGSIIDMKGGQYSDRIEKIYKIVNGKTVEVDD